MSLVTVRSNWGYFDALDGEDLKDGDVILVTWKDRTSSEHVVFTKDRGFVSVKEGYIPDIRANIMIEHRGAPAAMELRNSKLELKRVKQAKQVKRATRKVKVTP